MSYFDDHDPAPLVLRSVSSSSPNEYSVCPLEFLNLLSSVLQLTVTGSSRMSTCGSSGAFSLALRLFRLAFHSSSRWRASWSSRSSCRFHRSTAFLHTLFPDAWSPRMIDMSASLCRAPSQYSTVTPSA